MKKQNYIALILLLMSTAFLKVALAADLPSSTQITSSNGTVTQGVGVPSNQELIRDFCPPVESLVRNAATQNWTAPNGWGTVSPSFLRTVDNFTGAQWVGIGVGEIICVYTKIGRSTFPVMLQRKKLAPAPLVGGVWSADKGGYMECKSNDVKQCPFFIQVPKKEENLYEQLDFYKGKPVESN